VDELREMVGHRGEQVAKQQEKYNKDLEHSMRVLDRWVIEQVQEHLKWLGQ
jgi:hypothetical protein